MGNMVEAMEGSGGGGGGPISWRNQKNKREKIRWWCDFGGEKKEKIWK